MKQNILINRLPEKVNVDGTDYPINWDFRTGIRFEVMLRDSSISDEEKIKRMLAMYFSSIPANPVKALEAILWFYGLGENREDKPETEKQSPKQLRRTGQRRKKRTVSYSFAQDGAYIYSSFMEQYGLNLYRLNDKDMHWWEFMALFEGLSEHTQMGRIMYYRTVSTSGMPAAKRRAINEMKKIYAIRDDISCDKKVALAQRNANWRAYVESRMNVIPDKALLQSRGGGHN